MAALPTESIEHAEPVRLSPVVVGPDKRSTRASPPASSSPSLTRPAHPCPTTSCHPTPPLPAATSTSVPPYLRTSVPPYPVRKHPSLSSASFCRRAPLPRRVSTSPPGLSLVDRLVARHPLTNKPYKPLGTGSGGPSTPDRVPLDRTQDSAACKYIVGQLLNINAFMVRLFRTRPYPIQHQPPLDTSYTYSRVCCTSSLSACALPLTSHHHRPASLRPRPRPQVIEDPQSSSVPHSRASLRGTHLTNLDFQPV